MNLRNRTILNVFAFLTVALSTVSSARVCRAAPVCSNNAGNSPSVCVDWNGIDDPELNFDFRFDFTDPANPGVTLLTGDPGWMVWSQLGGVYIIPGNLGAIKIDPTLPTDNFGVELASPVGQPGAANVGSIVLSAANWTGNSSISGGEIAGNLTGDLTVVQDGAGAGGEAAFTISGNATGNITIPTIATGARLDILGDASGTVQVGEVVGPGITGGVLHVSSVSGTVEAALMKGWLQVGSVVGTGAVRVTQRMDGGTLSVGDAAPTASVVIADMVNGSVVTLSEQGATWAGRVRRL